MKDFLLKLLTLIVSHPESLEISEQKENGLQIYLFSVHPEDIGRVIGKQGRVINAIRTLARLKAGILNERVLVKINTPDQKGYSLPTATGSEEVSSTATE